MIALEITNKEDARTIMEIAQRARAMAAADGQEYTVFDADMDIRACHLNGCRLNLGKLLAADDFNFAHDVYGIRRHLNRETGRMENCFFPRSAQ